METPKQKAARKRNWQLCLLHNMYFMANPARLPALSHTECEIIQTLCAAGIKRLKGETPDEKFKRLCNTLEDYHG